MADSFRTMGDVNTLTAAVADEILDGVDDVAPSENAVFDALALKQDEAFTPGVGGDWDGPPATIQAALDELAARVKAIEDSLA